MKSSPITVRGCIAFALLALCPGIRLGQDTSGQSQSLGDVARKTRKQQSAAGHARAKSLVNEEEDGPDTTGFGEYVLVEFDAMQRDLADIHGVLGLMLSPWGKVVPVSCTFDRGSTSEFQALCGQVITSLSLRR
jgi:hypothetical protein